MKGWLDRWVLHWSQPVGTRLFAVFRICFGGILLAEAFRIGSEIDGNSPNDLTELAFRFKYLGFGWVELLPLPILQVLEVIMVVAALLVAAGLLYRAAVLFYGLIYLYFFLVDMSHFNNHYYFLLLLLAGMLVTDPHKVWSVDRFLFRFRGVDVPRWQYGIFRFQVVWVYFCAGLVKLQPDWLSMRTMEFAMTRGRDYTDQALFQNDGLIGLYTYGGLAFDLLIGWMLLYRRTRVVAVVCILIFHSLNAMTLSIGVFPFLMVAACLLFFETATSGNTYPVPVVKRRWLGATLGAYMVIQLLLPARHHLIAGRVDWTGEGAMFAWRMKASGRSGHTGHFLIYMHDRTTGEEIRPVIALSDRQMKFLLYRPVLFLQVRDQLLEITGRTCTDTKMTADVWCSINNHPYAPLIDPDADLCRSRRQIFRHQPFITLHP